MIHAAREMCVGLRPLLALSQIPVLLGYIMVADVTSGIAAAEHAETGSESRAPRPTSDAPRCAPSPYPANLPGGGRHWRLPPPHNTPPPPRPPPPPPHPRPPSPHT